MGWPRKNVIYSSNDVKITGFTDGVAVTEMVGVFVGVNGVAVTGILFGAAVVVVVVAVVVGDVTGAVGSEAEADGVVGNEAEADGVVGLGTVGACTAAMLDEDFDRVTVRGTATATAITARMATARMPKNVFLERPHIFFS